MRKKKPEKAEEKIIIQDGIAEDLIRSIVQIGCAETHAKTLIEKYTAQLENGLTDDPDKTMELLTDATDEMNSLTELRRGIMLRLFQMFDGNKDFHCMVKHIGIGMYTLFEAYQASSDDPELYTLYLEANRRFIKALSNYLGMDPIDCASCFGDFLLAKRKEN